MKRTVFGLFWFVVLSFGTALSLDRVIGAIGHARGNSQQEVEQQADRAAQQWNSVILLASAGAVFCGTATQKLPGTK